MRWNTATNALTLLALAGIGWPVLGEPLTLLLAATEEGQSDVKRYLVSEKLDGVRAFWDGQRLLTRNAHPIPAPDWFIANFPKQALDGELWIGRREFERLSGLVRRQTVDDAAWRDVRYMVFELPQAPGSFRQRVQSLQELVNRSGVPWLQVVEQFEIASRQALERKLDEVLHSGGEGLMLHRADAAYVTGRSDVLLKVKRWRDAEATVVGYQPGQGRYLGMLGALRVRTTDGVEFMLGTGLSDAVRRNPPPLGSQLVFRYRDLTARGRPRFASFHRWLDL
ncbi:DNA ligase [Accumulibacter sp.]|uniref:DNA ligase n=1 Tax=Accumulibacter sp. TaxID=2053492 RepID=UPI00261F9774|nr:DNA ligase [Accumulibacter sp.]